ncbi:unnamed protein product [Moneuplotes crassus]|uniref:Palmitoyltransferase n=1 Tax=Euplotes crassus TaxID=5936 RepID=A0AAD2D4G0_EUPCR|nr:unnamed protein product [Moneuplotes crassus]
MEDASKPRAIRKASLEFNSKNYTKFESSPDVEDSNQGELEIDASLKNEIYLEKQPKGTFRIVKMGNCYATAFNKNGDPWITLGPNYVFTIILYLFLAGLSVVLMIIISQAKKEFWFFKIIAIVLIFLAFLSLSLTVFINPGHPSKSNEKYQIPHDQVCRYCNVPKSKSRRIYHCDICNLCVEDYDHHCPWMGKCIGGGNIIQFYLFLFSLCFVLFATFLSSSLILKPRKNKVKDD